MPQRVMFVCLGNICRSPAGEGVLRARAEARGLDGALEVASSGTSAYHRGELPDRRMRAAAERRGYALTSRAQPFERRHFAQYDLIVPMDRQNLADVLALARDDGERGRVRLLSSFLDNDASEDVPDPYYGGDAGFERVLDMIEGAADAILDDVAAHVDTAGRE